MIKSFKIGEAFEREIDCSDPDVIEYEGLGYDPKTGNLLLAAKQRVKDVDNKKMIYAYDFNRKVLFKSIAIPEEKLVGKDGKKCSDLQELQFTQSLSKFLLLLHKGKTLDFIKRRSQRSFSRFESFTL